MVCLHACIGVEKDPALNFIYFYCICACNLLAVPLFVLVTSPDHVSIQSPPLQYICTASLNDQSKDTVDIERLLSFKCISAFQKYKSEHIRTPQSSALLG